MATATHAKPANEPARRRYVPPHRRRVPPPDPTPTPAEWTRPCNDFMQNRAPGKRLLDAEHVATKYTPSKTGSLAGRGSKEATHIMRTAFLEVTHELCHRAFKRMVTSRDFALKDVKPPGLAMNAEQDKAVYKLAAWRVAQIWYGVGSDKERKFAAHCGSHLSQLAATSPGATESLVVAMVHNLCVSANNLGGGGAKMFAPVAQRNYLNNASPLLDNEVAVYCLLETCATGAVYLHASERLRYDFAFNCQLVTMAGDDVLARIDPSLYDTPSASWLVRTARALHYDRNKDRLPWLRTLSTEPVFRVGATTLDFVGMHCDRNKDLLPWLRTLSTKPVFRVGATNLDLVGTDVAVGCPTPATPRRLYAHAVVPPHIRRRFNNDSLREAVRLYLRDEYREWIVSKHGPMEDWDVSGVTSMSGLFSGREYTLIPDLSHWDVSNVTDMSDMFAGAVLFDQDLSKWDVSKVTDMDSMFNSATAFNGDVSTWDVSNVTNMNSMFGNAWSFCGDLSKWDVSKVTDMSYMFYSAKVFDCDLSSWRTPSLKGMDCMFASAWRFNSDLSDWDVSRVRHTRAVFKGAHAFNGDVSAWDVRNCSSFEQMFEDARSFNCDLGAWTVRHMPRNGCGQLKGFLRGADAFDKALSPTLLEQLHARNFCRSGRWLWRIARRRVLVPLIERLVAYYWMELAARPDAEGNAPRGAIEAFCDDFSGVSEVADTSHAEYGAASFDNDSLRDAVRLYLRDEYRESVLADHGPMERWDVSGVTSMSGLFSGTGYVPIPDLSRWDVSNVTDMGDMFAHTATFNQDLSAWDVSKVTNMDCMFNNATAFDGDLSTWDVSNVTNMNSMFGDAWYFNGDLSKWDVSKVTDMCYMFYDARVFNCDLNSWRTSSLKKMESMFAGAWRFNSDLSNWDVSRVRSMRGVFKGAHAFNGDVSTWDVRRCACFEQTFEDARSFNCDLSLWTPRVPRSGVVSMGGFMYGAYAFQESLSPLLLEHLRPLGFRRNGRWLWRLARRRVLVPLIERHVAYYWMELGARPDAEGNAPRGAIEAFCDDF